MITHQTTIASANVAQQAFSGLSPAQLATVGQRYITIKADPNNGTEIYYGVASILNGTVSITNGTAALIGVGTIFTQELVVGSIIRAAGQTFTVSTITNDTSLTISANASADVTSQPFTTWISPSHRSYRLDGGDTSSTFIVHRLQDVVVVSASASMKYYIQASQ